MYNFVDAFKRRIQNCTIGMQYVPNQYIITVNTGICVISRLDTII